MENIFSILACLFYCKIWTNLKMFSINYKIIYKMFYVKKLDKTFKKKNHTIALPIFGGRPIGK